MGALYFIAVGVILSVCSPVLGATVNCTKELDGFTIDDFISNRFYYESFNGTWISG